MSRTITTAAVQDSSVVFDREANIEKVHELTGKSGKLGADIVAFPEAIVSGYPNELDFGARVGSRSLQRREDFRRYFDSAVEVPGAAPYFGPDPLKGDDIFRNVAMCRIIEISLRMSSPECSGRSPIHTA